MHPSDCIALHHLSQRKEPDVSRNIFLAKLFLSLANMSFVFAMVMAFSPQGRHAFTWDVIMLIIIGAFIVGFLPYKRLIQRRK